MSVDDDTTTLGEYFDPIPLLPASPPEPPASGELVRVLTADIRRATNHQMLSTPALAEVLIARGWRPVLPASLMPPWAIPVAAQVCVTVSCSRCSEQLESDGGTIHFTSIQEAREYLPDCGWRAAGDVVLCAGCQDAEDGE